VTASPTVITIGNLDGVHLGHQELLRRVQQRAASGGFQAAAMFFNPPPVEYFAPERAPGRLTTLSRRSDLLRSFGVQDVLVESFDAAFASLSPEAFVDEILIGRANAREVIVGPFFAFGKDRAGTLEVLRTLGKERDLHIDVVSAVELDSSRISSTRVRNALKAGDLTDVTQCLARVHDVGGVVVHGDHRARTLGFPTANLDCEAVIMPPDGVYSVMVKVADRETLYPGVANLGVRPTFSAGRSVEVHLFDFEEDLYGSELRVGFCTRLRDEKRFDGLEALVHQIQQDCSRARHELAQISLDLLSHL